MTPAHCLAVNRREIERIRKRHWRIDRSKVGAEARCSCDPDALWPCDAARLLFALDVVRQRGEGSVALHEEAMRLLDLGHAAKAAEKELDALVAIPAGRLRTRAIIAESLAAIFWRAHRERSNDAGPTAATPALSTEETL